VLRRSNNQGDASRLGGFSGLSESMSSLEKLENPKIEVPGAPATVILHAMLLYSLPIATWEHGLGTRSSGGA
jgi:hypothetical protein